MEFDKFINQIFDDRDSNRKFSQGTNLQVTNEIIDEVKKIEEKQNQEMMRKFCIYGYSKAKIDSYN